MTRFLAGVALGAIAAVITYGATGSRSLTVIAGCAVAVFIWIWPLTRAELTDNDQT